MYIRYNENNEVTDYSLSPLEGEGVVNLHDAPLRIDIRQPEKLMYRDGLFIKLDDQEMTLEQSKEYHRVLDEQSRCANLLEVKIGQARDILLTIDPASSEYEENKARIAALLEDCQGLLLMAPYHTLLATFVDELEAIYSALQ